MSSLNQSDLGEIVSGLAWVLPTQPRIYDAALVFWDYLIEHGLDIDVVLSEASRCGIQLDMAGYALGLAALAKEPVVVQIIATGRVAVLPGYRRLFGADPPEADVSEVPAGSEGQAFVNESWVEIMVLGPIFDLEVFDIPDARQFGPRYFR
jgi:hypothetical protein